MELEVGMYVRTKCGIGKLLYFNEELEEWVNEEYNYYTEDYIVKASYNIIDLIEVGDYVNGEKTTRVIPQDICGDEVLDYQHIFVNDKEIYKEDIKTIVTKEQMEAIQYKVV